MLTHEPESAINQSNREQCTVLPLVTIYCLKTQWKQHMSVRLNVSIIIYFIHITLVFFFFVFLMSLLWKRENVITSYFINILVVFHTVYSLSFTSVVHLSYWLTQWFLKWFFFLFKKFVFECIPLFVPQIILTFILYLVFLFSILLTVQIRGWQSIFSQPPKLLWLWTNLHSHPDPYPDSNSDP